VRPQEDQALRIECERLSKTVDVLKKQREKLVRCSGLMFICDANGQCSLYWQELELQDASATQQSLHAALAAEKQLGAELRQSGARKSVQVLYRCVSWTNYSGRWVYDEDVLLDA